jgi:hypothetical protein
MACTLVTSIVIITFIIRIDLRNLWGILMDRVCIRGVSLPCIVLLVGTMQSTTARGYFRK